MRNRLSTKRLEARRWRGVHLLANGLSQAEVAAQLGVTRQAVSKWKRAYDGGGEAALASKRRRGLLPRLSAEQLLQVDQILRRIATTERLTIRRAVELVRDRFGVSYSEGGLTHRLRRMGWRRAGSKTRPAWRAPQV